MNFCEVHIAKDGVSHFFNPIQLTPYHLTPICSPLYHLTPQSFNPYIISPRFKSFYKITIIKLAINHFAMFKRSVGLDMKLSQQNVGLIYPLNYDKTCL